LFNPEPLHCDSHDHNPFQYTRSTHRHTHITLLTFLNIFRARSPYAGQHTELIVDGNNIYFLLSAVHRTAQGSSLVIIQNRLKL